MRIWHKWEWTSVDYAIQLTIDIKFFLRPRICLAFFKVYWFTTAYILFPLNVYWFNVGVFMHTSSFFWMFTNLLFMYTSTSRNLCEKITWIQNSGFNGELLCIHPLSFKMSNDLVWKFYTYIHFSKFVWKYALE